MASGACEHTSISASFISRGTKPHRGVGAPLSGEVSRPSHPGRQLSPLSGEVSRPSPGAFAAASRLVYACLIL